MFSSVLHNIIYLQLMISSGIHFTNSLKTFKMQITEGLEQHCFEGFVLSTPTHNFHPWHYERLLDIRFTIVCVFSHSCHKQFRAYPGFMFEFLSLQGFVIQVKGPVDVWNFCAIESQQIRVGRDLRRSSSPIPCSKQDQHKLNHPSQGSVKPGLKNL